MVGVKAGAVYHRAAFKDVLKNQTPGSLVVARQGFLALQEDADSTG